MPGAQVRRSDSESAIETFTRQSAPGIAVDFEDSPHQDARAAAPDSRLDKIARDIPPQNLFAALLKVVQSL
jgi:hypothetical protein